jgi:hypothetical protein
MILKSISRILKQHRISICIDDYGHIGEVFLSEMGPFHYFVVKEKKA